MSKARLYLFDTTLRDGAQTAGIEFSLEDKIRIAGLLEEIGVDYIEGGYPGANVVDDATRRPVDWPNVRPSALLTIAGLKVGVIGVTTLATPTSTIAAWRSPARPRPR